MLCKIVSLGGGESHDGERRYANPAELIAGVCHHHCVDGRLCSKIEEHTRMKACAILKNLVREEKIRERVANFCE